MGNLDVAVKTIHKQHVNPHLTAQQAEKIIGKVTSCSFCCLAIADDEHPHSCVMQLQRLCYVCCSALHCKSLKLYAVAGAQDLGNVTF